MTTDSKLFSAVVIGCGKMGGGVEESWSRDGVFSHAAAYNKHPNFQLIAGVEPQPTTRDYFSNIWRSPHTFGSLDDCINSGLKFEVASICVPTGQHADILRKLLETDVLAVLCEKPLTDNYRESKDILNSYRQSNKLLSVNYPKRYFEGVLSLKHELDNGYWGKIKSAVGFYNKGVRNNGSHIINLLQYLLGNIRIKGVTRSSDEFDPRDPTIDAFLETDSGVPMYLVGGDHKDFVLFEIHLVAEKGVVTIEQSGNRIRRRRTTSHPNAKGYKALNSGEWWDENIETGILPVVNNLWHAISNGKSLVNENKQAVETDFICSSLTATANALGREELDE